MNIKFFFHIFSFKFYSSLLTEWEIKSIVFKQRIFFENLFFINFLLKRFVIKGLLARLISLLVDHDVHPRLFFPNNVYQRSELFSGVLFIMNTWFRYLMRVVSDVSSVGSFFGPFLPFFLFPSQNLAKCKKSKCFQHFFILTFAFYVKRSKNDAQTNVM